MYYESVFLAIIMRLLHKISDIYYSSRVAGIIKSFSNAFKTVFDNSKVWKFIKRNDYISGVWEHSFFYIIVNWTLNLPGAILSKICVSNLSVFVENSSIMQLLISSRIFKLLRLAFAHFEIIIGVSVIFIAIVEHNRWNNIYGTLIIGALFVIYYFKAAVQKYKAINLKVVDFALFAFIVSVIFAEITGIFPKESLRFFVFYSTCFLYMLLIAGSIRTAKSLNRLVEIILIGISITGVYAVYQGIVGVPTDPRLTDLTMNAGMPGRVFSTMQNPNNYAEILILTIPFFAAAVFNAEGILKKLFFAALALPPFIALFETGSRSSWIGLVIAILVFVFFKEKRLIPVAILLGVLSLPVLRVVKPSVYLRAMTIFNASNDTSYSYRGLIFNTFKPMLKDFWFTGIGLGSGIANQTFMKIIQRYPLFDSAKMSVYPPHTHNLFLQIWIEVGFVGIVTFVWFIIRMIKKCAINIFKGVDQKISHILMAGTAAVCGSLVMGLAEYTWFYPRAMMFFWIDIGIILAGLSILNRKSSSLPSNNQ